MRSEDVDRRRVQRVFKFHQLRHERGQPVLQQRVHRPRHLREHFETGAGHRCLAGGRERDGAQALVVARMDFSQAQFDQLAHRPRHPGLADPDRLRQLADRHRLLVQRGQQGHVRRLHGQSRIADDLGGARLHAFAQAFEAAAQKYGAVVAQDVHVFALSDLYNAVYNNI